MICRQRNFRNFIKTFNYLLVPHQNHHNTRVSSRSTSDDAASMPGMDRLGKTNEFVLPPLGSTEARELAIRWKEDGRLPSRLAIAWMSKGLAPGNEEEKNMFLRDKTDRVSLSFNNRQQFLMMIVRLAVDTADISAYRQYRPIFTVSAHRQYRPWSIGRIGAEPIL